MRTQVGIVGAGPAGLLLGHLLRQAGIDACVIERRDRDYIEGRVRAGVLEHTTVDLLTRLGLDGRLRRDGLTHTGTILAHDGDSFRIDFAALTGASVTVYGQQDVMRDLFDAAPAAGLPIVFDAGDVALHGIDSARPRITWTGPDGPGALDCDYIAGCDGFHGVSRAALADRLEVFERVYPFGWLGILADVPPANHELIYASHAHGFALASMRSATRSRYYIQCDSDERVEDWPDERFWDELCVRLGDTAAHVIRGPSFEKSVAPLRSFVAAPMRWGNLFLAGDAAHIVPPTGAKGLNLAAADVAVLAAALVHFYRTGEVRGLDGYSDRALARVWKAERFSWWFTSLMHRFPSTDTFGRQMQVAELAYIKGSVAAQTSLAENYVGLPLESRADKGGAKEESSPFSRKRTKKLLSRRLHEDLGFICKRIGWQNRGWLRCRRRSKSFLVLFLEKGLLPSFGANILHFPPERLAEQPPLIHPDYRSTPRPQPARPADRPAARPRRDHRPHQLGAAHGRPGCRPHRAARGRTDRPAHRGARSGARRAAPPGAAHDGGDLAGQRGGSLRA